jgi:MFS-type transporter involved in bile tolerance (Atg22 family)
MGRRTHYGRVMGLMSPFVFAVIALGPSLAGLLYDATGSYSAVFAVVCFLLALAIALLPFLQLRHRDEERRIRSALSLERE